MRPALAGSRWTGAKEAMAYFGLLSCIHKLLPTTIETYMTLFHGTGRKRPL